jgi:hypothetical protein
VYPDLPQIYRKLRARALTQSMSGVKLPSASENIMSIGGNMRPLKHAVGLSASVPLALAQTYTERIGRAALGTSIGPLS